MDLKELRGLQERLTVDTSEDRPVYLLMVRNGSYLRVSSSAYHLLRQLSQGVTFEQIAQAMTRHKGEPVAASEVETAYRTLAERIEKIEQQEKKLPWGYWIAVKLLPASLVQRVSAVLARGFHSSVVPWLVGLIATAGAALVGSGRSLHFEAESFVQGYLLFLLSLVAHEFGHSSACARYGAAPSEIGFTIYLIYPAFYSDVSSAWQLKRWQRVVVDLGGIFFQLVVGALYAIAYVASGHPALGNALLMIGASCFFALNPIFKFDGYWAVADALGVTNLAKQPGRIVRHLWSKLRKQAVPPLPWPLKVTAVLGVYTVLSFAIWGFFLSKVLPIAWQHGGSYAQRLHALWEMLLQLPEGWQINVAQAWLASTYLLVITGIMLMRLLKPVAIALRRWLFGASEPQGAKPAVPGA